jgi:hypothetical protein
MNRIGLLVPAALLTVALVGCDGGMKEGMNQPEPGQSAQPPGFEDMMKKNAEKMQLKGGRPKDIPKAKPTGDEAATPAK